MIDEINKKGYSVKCIDGAEGIMLLPDKSIKLIYGSPPYPNAKRNYGVIKSEEYISWISPFIDAAILKLRDDGFLVINIKANREKPKSKGCSTRSLIVEKLAILLEEKWELHCVDIEIWAKTTFAPTGNCVACQDIYEQNLWFAINRKWKIDIDAIRRPYSPNTFRIYSRVHHASREGLVQYYTKDKTVTPNPLGALPVNVISGACSSRRGSTHQAIQPMYLPEKYIKACTSPGDLVVDPWLGSGTTGVAALKLGRTFAGFDIYQEFVENAEKWMEEEQNKEADK